MIPKLKDILAKAIPFWNENPIHRQKIKELTANLEEKLSQPIARSGSVEGQRPLPAVYISLPGLRVNAVAAEIYSRLDTFTERRKELTIPA